MLKVIIADDERIQREGLVKHIPWNEFHMEVVGTAAEGIEGLELVKLHRPDVLVTDVRMPGMSGLELSQKARELLPNIKILIISGYEEFEYARTAIELNAYAFILKPVNIGKMREELRRISMVFASEMKAAEEINDMKRQLEESKPLLKDKFTKDLFFGFISDEETIIRKSRFLSINVPNSEFCVVLMDVEESNTGEVSEEEAQFFAINLQKLLVKAVNSFSDGLAVQMRDGEFALLISVKGKEQMEVQALMEAIVLEVYNTFSKLVTVGISSIKKLTTEVNLGYKEAEMALKQKFYLGKGKCIYFNDIKLENRNPEEFEQQCIDIISNVQLGNCEKVEDEIDKLFARFASSLTIDQSYVKAFCFRIMSDVYRVLYDMNENIENIFGNETVLWDKIYRFETIPDVRQWVKNILIAVTKYIFSKRTGRNSWVVNTIVNLLEERYYEQITIDELAKKVFLTPNYVCNIFKESIGESIIDYLTKIRMKHAQRLLMKTDMKVYEIAEKTGFNSTSYFSIVFKNTYGISPKEYRDSFDESMN